MYIDPSAFCKYGGKACAPAEKAVPSPEIIEALNGTYYDWWAESDYLLRVGLTGDLVDLRLRLNAAFTNARNSSRVAPKAS
jgi:hypothetical protein